MLKKFLFLILITIGLLTSAPVLAQEEDTGLPPVYFFYGDGCPHCAEEEEFFEDLKLEFPELQINSFEVWYNKDNASFLQEVAKDLDVKNSGVPVTVIGENVVVGFNKAETTGVRIKSYIEACLENTCIDAVSQIKEGSYEGLSVVLEEDETCDEACAPGAAPEIDPIHIPFFGDFSPQFFSLPVLTIIIAALDGFNPCAMWVLLFLISLLLNMQDRKKMWILGGSFIFTSGAVYFLFLAAWLNLFLFIGFISLVRIAIGIVAIASGSYHLREWWTNKDGTCKVSKGKFKQWMMSKLKSVTEQHTFYLALAGIIVLAIAVNMVELVCSAGLPAIYTQVLALSNLSPIGYYGYLLLYIVIFMLDDMLVFTIAMVTLQSTGFSGKYTHWSNLLGGLLIFILGILLIFKPEIIMLGF